MKLKVLGSGAAMFNPGAPYRYPASHLVQTSKGNILLDAGIGVLPQITNLGLVVGDITTIAISHFHADHFTLQPLLQAYMLEGKFKGNKLALHMLGPKGIEERARIGFDQSGFSYKDDFLPNVEVKFTEYTDKEKVELYDEVFLTPFATNHYGLDAYALRIEADKTITYSGDSTVSVGLETAAKDVDLFLCEASALAGNPSDAGHLNPKDAAEVAARAGSKRLVITHYSGHDSVDVIAQDARGSSFTGKIDVATDLSSYEI